MDPVFWGPKVVIVIFLTIAAFTVGKAGLFLIPAIIISYAGIKLGGFLGAVLIIFGVIFFFLMFYFLPKAKSRNS